MARETGEEEATVREEIRARKEAGEAKRKEDERWVGFCSVNRILSNFIRDCIKVPIAEPLNTSKDLIFVGRLNKSSCTG